jgi:Plant transposon protein
MWNTSLEAKVLLPIKTLAYGVACHCFCDYFQMSTTTARWACQKFNSSMALLFRKEYLRLPSAEDLKSITKLHEKAHGVEGMIGSLDCMHTYWKNCPVGWQQSYQGKDKVTSTIVLEAIADHYLWFWHASYGYGGALNDIYILQQSPLMRRLTNGTFTKTEKESGATPSLWRVCRMLVDGIYPTWCQFIRGFKEPLTIPEQRFTTWQEGARKDVERAFGVFQCKWKAIASPIHFIEPNLIGEMISCCVILHNMGVSDRVMGDLRKRYDPGSVPFTEREVTAPHDLH